MKVLIIGGAGMLGHRCFETMKEIFGTENVACTIRKSKGYYQTSPIFSNGIIFDNIDVTNFADVEKCLNTFAPSVIINCVGLTLRKPEMSDYDKVIELNSMLPHRLALWGLTHSARVIHFSTDCVFDGGQGNYTELSPPSASDLYGKSKFLGEIHYPNSLTLRLSIVGREIEAKTELIEWFLSQKNKTISGFSNVFYSGLTTNQVAIETAKIIRDFPNISGLFQMSSEPISKFDLLTIVNEVYENQTVIQKNETYKSNKVLDCAKLESVTGFKRPSWRDMIQNMKNEERATYGE